MPFERPTLSDLRRRIAQDVMVRLPGTDALLRWNNLAIIGEVEAGLAHLLYGRLDWSFRQLFPDTAEAEFLERWASVWGVQRRAATTATGMATWLASDSAFIPEGAVAVRGDGTRYTVTTGASVIMGDAGGTITVPLEAVLAGAGGNADTDVQLTLATTQPNVTPLGRVDAPGLGGGAATENDSLLLQRLLARIRYPPHGGTASDYIQWAMEVPGVTRAWVYPLEQGPGTVVVRFMTDELTPDGIPSPASVALVQAHIETVRPVTAHVFVAAPDPDPLDIRIANLEPDTPTIRDGIGAELRDLMRRETEPGGLLHLSRIFARINSAPGVLRFHLLEPTNDVQAPLGHITTLGSVSYA